MCLCAYGLLSHRGCVKQGQTELAGTEYVIVLRARFSISLALYVSRLIFIAECLVGPAYFDGNSRSVLAHSEPLWLRS